MTRKSSSRRKNHAAAASAPTRAGVARSAVAKEKDTPRFSNYRPQFFLRTTDVVGIITVNSADIVLPGDTADLTIKLGQPVAITVGEELAIHEGKRTVGVGTVSQVLD